MNDWADRSQLIPATGRRDRRRAGIAALRISAVYLVFGILWIALSDEAVAYLARATGDPFNLLSRFEMIKGFCFVAATAVLLYFLVRSYNRSVLVHQLRTRRTLASIARDYQLLFRSNPLPMWIFDPKTLRILAANDQALSAYGFSREEFLGLSITELRPQECIPELMRALANLPQTVQHTGPITHKKKNGELFSVEVIGHAIQFEDAPARLVMALDVTDRLRTEKALEEYRTLLEHRVQERTADLSALNRSLQHEVKERQKVEAELRRATEIAEEASNAKSVFLANTTHEIRTPLTSILGYADLLLDVGLYSEQRAQYLTVLRQNATHLLRMIDDLLDLSRIETGNLRFTLDDYSPTEIAEQTLELLRPRAAAKDLPLYLELRDPLPKMIRTDGVRLRQILLNLLSNAIKFTNTGSVSLVVHQATAGGAPETFWLQFDVIDTGIGIAGEQLERIFEPFYQIDQSESRHYGGAGLGLAISRKLVDQMGGTLEVSSQPGRGSHFRLKIPVLAPARFVQAARPLLQMNAQMDGRVLLAEDNANIRWLVEEYLRRGGAAVTAVANGTQAVSAVQRAKASHEQFDLILLDINMPGMDGLEAMNRIRATGYAGPVVALTAHHSPEEQARFMGAGWDAIAPKPINRYTFIPLIARLIGRKRQATIQQ
ncbi:MAG TPA: ATP-binding protein [Phycisphaerae bacterium]|nr:ATP-binding protein [Phycisphaerae bacterium]